jgi:hypothetical protein
MNDPLALVEELFLEEFLGFFWTGFIAKRTQQPFILECKGIEAHLRQELGQFVQILMDVLQDLREQELLSPQFLNRIPEFRSLLEFKSLSGFPHIAFEFGNVFVERCLGLEFRDAF